MVPTGDSRISELLEIEAQNNGYQNVKPESQIQVWKIRYNKFELDLVGKDKSLKI